ncbi:MAG: type I DNA topoisomerase [Melioribacteraceae bacterium]|nr:type I DNA topoisomerase [Melioribacteraceae bacterium]
MSKNLVLVESPSKAKTINKYLGRSYKVEATVGHIRNLPKTKLGIDIENGFEPKLLNIRGKGDLIKQIKNDAKKSDKIYIATDPDREGEAIAQDIVDVIEGKTKATIYRVLFNEITKTSVKAAMKNPIEIDNHVVTSQRARRVMDRIIGYKISPILWTAIIDEAGNSLSAGRVQSVSLRLICEREEEIEKFIATEYWSIWIEAKTDSGDILKAKLVEVDGKSLKIQPKPEMEESDWKEFLNKNFAINSEEGAKEIAEKIKGKNNFHISDIKKKEIKRNPSPPFITSTLQAEASRRLRLRPRNTMRVAQSLYEGVDLGEEGVTGLITYMRTDSTRLNIDIVNDAKEFITKRFGEEYSVEKPRTFEKSKSKNIQDAHEAIRPTSINYTPEFVKQYLNDEQFKLYEIVWNRFIASQMEVAIHETTTVLIKADEFLFRLAGTVIKFDGFQKIYEESKEENSNKEESENTILPKGLEKEAKLTLENLEKNQHFTKPPPRYTESSLIKELESNGIGRPSTYASIIGTLQDRDYVNQTERKLFPTKLGKRVNEILIKNFHSIFNVNFTAQMESELDQIANGEIEYIKVLNDFYNPFLEAITEAESKIEKIKCDKCNSDMEIKIGRFGKFLACTNYPDCKNIKSLREAKDDAEPEYTGEDCPKCGSKTIFRNSRFGKFIGCEKYPDCDYTKQITLGIKCPKCKEGDVITRRSKRGKFFYGCNKYPDCDYISWTKPKEEGSEEEESE